MTKLTILANIIAKDDKVDLVKSELLKLIDLTRAEEGCLDYNLHQDAENPAHFMFYENWQSRELWQHHMNADYMAAYGVAVDEAVESWTLNEMTHIA
ncbi:putative quinol monooxygenase [Paraglaciecola sp. L1A13]|uniref:putative quinol monooxygenase n=1 Tax=Paraglaciecola sp. L1A13 TaxID=2686359 RepID=UPI00131D38C7|nr:putative quinol monooxygenase [Paraglaciecola sp. L1A13]